MQLVQKLLSTRGGTIALGGVAAVLAAFVLLLYLNQYRSSVSADTEPVTVLVAKTLIEKGMPGDVVGLRRLFDRSEAPKSQVREGAITDPSALRGRIAVDDIYPGQQLTVADFGVTTDAIGAKLAGRHRAIAVPVDAARGMVGNLEPGDRVDVLAGFNVLGGPNGAQGRPVVKVIMQNALVLDAPEDAGAGVATAQTANVVLRVNRDQATEIAWAVDNGKVWVVLRPRAGAPPTKPGVVTAESLLTGVRPVAVYGKVRRLVGGRP
ncbi:MAG: Flp pilus assembly protein CpaB [Actinomycetota bacterium]|nr:Flp pilus assembly protein CpaB [Actinomycetota bacterium]